MKTIASGIFTLLTFSCLFTLAQPSGILQQAEREEISSKNPHTVTFSHSLPGNSEEYSWVDTNNTWKPVRGNTFVYDNNNHIALQYVKDANSDSLKYVFTYDDKGRQRTKITYEYISGTWKKTSMDSTGYDQYDYKTLDIHYSQQGSVWDTVVAEQFDYIYNSNGFPLQWTIKRFLWDAWNNTDKYEFTYDNSGFLAEYIRYAPDSSEWKPEERNTFINDANGWPVETVKQFWLNNTWTNYFRQSNIQWKDFDLKTRTGNFLSYLYEDWFNSGWRPNFRYTAQYDLNGGSVVIMEQYAGSGWWVNLARTTRSYDSHKNYTGFLREAWENNQWVKKEHYFYDRIYDASENLVESINRAWLPFYTDTVPSYRIVYSNFISTGVKQYTETSISLYPNPVKDRLFIDLSGSKSEHVSIYDLMGKEVYCMKVNEQRPVIDLSALVPGIYLVKAFGIKGTSVSKFIKN